MTEYAWPPALRPTRLSFYLQRNTLRLASPITRVTQVMRREGADATRPRSLGRGEIQ
jgi:hypothetical protein